ncbi:MAG: thiamine pyrophosphate-requiring protein [Actinomycetota bacterium]|nr:thiamine pyrophosphate-requiring protein [Actinomycetota bacterium]
MTPTPSTDPTELVADELVGRLTSWGVERVFGFSGDGIDPILGALRRAGAPELVTARHEESAAFMATAHAKWTGGLGCCLATHGPGAIHLLNGLYDAKLDKQPVLASVGQQHTTALGSGYQQEIDLISLFKDVCSAFLQTVTAPEQLGHVLDRAVRTALSVRAPTLVILPHDVQSTEAVPEPGRSHAVVTSRPAALEPPIVVPSSDALDRAAELLDAAERPAMLVGQGARGASREVMQVAEQLSAGVSSALLGKFVVAEDHPLVAGALGHLGTTASVALMERCDALLMIGTNEPYTEFLPAPDQARAVQIDIDGRRIGGRYPTEVDLLGDARATLAELLPRLRPRDRSAWRDEVTGAVERWREIAERRAQRPAEPLNPQLLLHELSPRLPDDALLAVDVGTVTYWYARHVRARGGIQGHLSSTLASMGSALPYSVAGKFAHPDRLVVALVGDGAMQMNGLNELITVARSWRGWTDPRLPILVLDNGDLNEVTWEQREMEGDPRFATSQEVTPVPYAEWAALLGLDGCVVERPDQVAAAWDRALSADRPFVLHARVDPAVPVLPPRLEPDARERLLAGLEQEDTPVGRRALDMVRTEFEEIA